MKLTQIALAVAATCVAAPSFALTLAEINSTPKNTVQLWISGATAPTVSIYKAVKKLCADLDANGIPDDLHVYYPAAANFSGKVAAYACTMGELAGPSLDTRKVLVNHTFDGGSFEAYTPHLLAIPGFSNPSVPAVGLRRLNNLQSLPLPPCTLVAAAEPHYINCGSSVIPTVANPTNPTTGPLATPTMPQGGFSDTEYVLNKLNLAISADLVAIGGEATTNVGQVFGLAVSYPLYYAMQQKDFADGKIAQTCLTGFTPALPSLIGTCQPNSNRQKYSSLVGLGSVTNKDGTLYGGALNSVIQVQRRVGTSGSQSASNAFFLNTPCATGEPAGARPAAGGNLAGTVSFNGGKVVVVSNAGSSNVKTNLTAASNAIPGVLAMGVLSMENIPSGTDKYAFVKLNGVSPNFFAPVNGVVNADPNQDSNAVKGDYEMWYELIAFTSSNPRTPAYVEGQDLILGISTALADFPLPGLFPTRVAGGQGGSKGGNACSVAVQ